MCCAPQHLGGIRLQQDQGTVPQAASLSVIYAAVLLQMDTTQCKHSAQLRLCSAWDMFYHMSINCMRIMPASCVRTQVENDLEQAASTFMRH